jgi:hypothetical protein
MPTYRIRDQDLQGKIIVLKPPAAGRFGRELIARLARCKPPQPILSIGCTDSKRSKKLPLTPNRRNRLLLVHGLFNFAAV